MASATAGCNCRKHLTSTVQLHSVAKARCVRPFSSGKTVRSRFVQVASAANQWDAQTCSNTSRRQLIVGSLLLTPFLISKPASADEAVPEAAAAAPEAAAVVEQTAPSAVDSPTTTSTAGSGIREKLTPEGAIRLTTNDEATKSLTPTNRQIFSLNRRVQAQNRAPDDFPGFIREGFDVTVVGEGYEMDGNGLIYKDFVVGSGSSPSDGQQVVFDYTAYNESGSIIDSSYRQGRSSETRLGIQGLIPGFEMGIKGMKPGGKRRIVVPPALGPPVGPQTFFSAKQCEVFDVELRRVKTCERRQMLMFSDVVCE